MPAQGQHPPGFLAADKIASPAGRADDEGGSPAPTAGGALDAMPGYRFLSFAWISPATLK